MTASNPNNITDEQQSDTPHSSTSHQTDPVSPRPPSRSCSRRGFLASTASAVAGLGLCGTVGAVGAPSHAQQTSSGNWTQEGANAANTARLTNGVGPTGNIKKEWETSLSRGRNNDGVAVVGETVYTSGDNLQALNVADGTERWSFSPTVPELDYPEGAVADVRSPAVMNGTVYATVGFEVYDTDATQHTALIAVNAKTGKKRWRIDSDGLTDGIFSPVTAANGLVYTSGPALKGSSSANNGGGLYAFDADTGDIRWRRRNGADVLPVADGRIYLPKEGKGVQALDAATGEVLWEVLPRVDAGSTAMVANGTLFVTEDDPPGVTLIALDAATGTEQWRTAYPSSEEYPDIDVSTVDDERVYIRVSNIAADVITLDRASGDERWRATIPQPPKKNGEQLTRVPTHGFARIGDLLYLGGAALNPANGAVVWTHGIPTPWIVEHRLAAVAGGRVYIVGNELYVLSGDTEPKLDISTETPTTTPSTPTTTTTPTPSTETQTRSPPQTPPSTPPQSSTPTQTASSSTQTSTSSPSPTRSPPTDTPPRTPQTTAANGPGFGILPAVAGAGLGTWRYLKRD
jgi:outer membrane protein assembly factor BamB